MVSHASLPVCCILLTHGLGEVAQALVPDGSCCGWPFNEALVTLVTTLSVAFPCIEYYSLAEFALALRHQHFW